jgi:hypothetical protein
VIENAGSVAVALPSDTAIAMLEYVVASLAAGVPLSPPVAVLNVAQDGLFAIEKVSVWPSGSDAVGVNAYAWPTVTDDGGVPLMTGARFVDWTVIEKAGSEDDTLPSLTLMTMLDVVPTLALAGVPDSVPLALSNVAQVGRFWMA